MSSGLLRDRKTGFAARQSAQSIAPRPLGSGARGPQRGAARRPGRTRQAGFFLASGRLDAESREARQQLRFSRAIVGQAEGHLATNEFFVANRYTVADIALYGYLQVAHEAGVDMEAFPNVAAWLERVREQPNHAADLEPYPENARRGKGQSIYDLLTIES